MRFCAAQWEMFTIRPRCAGTMSRAASWLETNAARTPAVLQRTAAKRQAATVRDASQALQLMSRGRHAGKVVLTGTVEEPMTPIIERAMQKRARAGFSSPQFAQTSTGVV